MDADSLRRGIVDHLHYSIGRPAAALRPEHYYRALALAVRDRMQDQQGRDHPDFAGPRPEGRVLSLGRVPDRAAARQQPAQPRHRRRRRARRCRSSARTSTSCSRCEEEPGLGNGGLGRLAACYLDSLATLEHPGDRLRHPLRVRHLRSGDPRRLAGRGDRQLAATRQPVGDRRSPRSSYQVGFGGHTEQLHRRDGPRSRPLDPGAGRQGRRLRHAGARLRRNTVQHAAAVEREARESFDLDAFNVGDYYRAVEEKVSSETITKVLYPERRAQAGKQLRLEQQYFFVSCSLQDILRMLDDHGRRPSRASPRQVRGPAQRHPPGARASPS